MRIIASVQSKRGSSRGLVHYLAHSKIDLTSERSEGRELFNAFSDQLSVGSANNFLKSDCGRERPANGELHHLVLSFKIEDYQRLGSSDRDRKKGLKSVARNAMERFEELLKSERLAWAGAIHLNTANPHIHVAIQKQFVGLDLKTRSLNKIPREALPHFEIVEGEKRIVEGIFIAAAKTKLTEIIGEKEGRRMPIKDEIREPFSDRTSHKETQEKFIEIDEERETLRRGILADYQLKFKKDKIESLIENRTGIKFTVVDPETGRNERLSLDDLTKLLTEKEPSTLSQHRQVNAIIHSILAKEESEYFKLEDETGSVRSDARKIRSFHKRRGTKLPTPAFRKSDLDELQNQCLATSRLRDFSYLERARIDLKDRCEIAPRTGQELSLLAGKRVVEEMKTQVVKRQISDLKDHSYYRRVSLGNDVISLADIDRDNEGRKSLVQTLRTAIETFGALKKGSGSKSKRFTSRMSVEHSLHEQITAKQREFRGHVKSTKALRSIFDRDSKQAEIVPKFSTNELLELETLSRKLKSPDDYAKYWEHQKSLLIEPFAKQFGTNKMSLGDQHSHANESAIMLLRGRAIAREVLSNIDLNKAKEELVSFQKSKRFHKFAIEDKKDGSISYLSLNDVDLSPKASVLDIALNRLLEGKDHRTLRRTVQSRVADREQSLKNDLAAAKAMSVFDSGEATKFQQPVVILDGTQLEAKPLFTPSEIFEIERRIAGSPIKKEVQKLTAILADTTRGDTNFAELLSTSVLLEENSENIVHSHSNDFQKAAKRTPPSLFHGHRVSNVPER